MFFDHISLERVHSETNIFTFHQMYDQQVKYTPILNMFYFFRLIQM